MPTTKGSAAGPWKGDFKDPEAKTDLARKATGVLGQGTGATRREMTPGQAPPRISRPPRIRAPITSGPQLGAVPRKDTETGNNG